MPQVFAVGGADDPSGGNNKILKEKQMNNINVYTGPMKSGKTGTIIQTAHSLINNGENVNQIIFIA